MKLLQSQKNALFDEVERLGMSPAQFEMIETNTTNLHNGFTQVKHRNSDFYFKIEKQTHDTFCRYSPGEQKYTESAYGNDWFSIENTFAAWIINLKRVERTRQMVEVTSGS